MLTRYAQGDLAWIDLVSPTPAELRSLMHEFDIDPLIAQELLTATFRQRVDRRGNVIYVTLQFSALRGIGRRPEQEIGFLIGQHFLITTRYESNDPLHAFAKTFEAETVLGNRGHVHGGHLFVAVVKSLYQALIDECDLLEQRLADIEERIFNGAERSMVIEISQTGRIIHDFRQSLTPHHEMLASLEPVAARMFGSEFSYYIKELGGIYTRVDYTIRNLRESLIELRETNNALLTTKQNEVMKTLTVLTFVFLPLVFIANLFGVYEHYLPSTGQASFWLILSAMGIIAILSLIYFKRRGWL